MGWNGLALVVFALAWTTLFYGVLGSAFNEHVSSSSWGVRQGPSGEEQLPEPDSLTHTDQRFVVWLTARNAQALLRNPARLFEAESCFPAENSLAFGEPGLSLGLLGIPAFALSRDPVATFNLVFFAITLIAAFAMYLLVREWTGEPGAGIVAGLLYAFSEIKIADVVHIHVYDNAWTVLALLFVSRLFAKRRWRDAVGLALCIVMQVSGSFYTVMAAIVVAIPMGVWLLRRHGPGALHPGQLALIVAAMLCTAAVIFPPYLELQGVGGLKEQVYQGFRSMTFLLPGADGFWGWATLALAMLAFALPRGGSLGGRAGDPRWALLAAAVLAVALSTASITHEGDLLIDGHGEDSLPYLWLARVVPGLDAVRAPGAILPAAHLVLCVLAGIGAAGLIRRVPARGAVWLIAGLTLLAAVETMRPSALGLAPRVRYGTIRMAPPAEDLALYEALAELGDDGPLLELPMTPKNLVRNSSDVLLTAYHGRRSSACYNPSRVPRELVSLSRRLPSDAALEAVSALGFTTVVLHHHEDDARARGLRDDFERAAAEGRNVGLRKLRESARLTVYRIGS